MKYDDIRKFWMENLTAIVVTSAIVNIVRVFITGWIPSSDIVTTSIRFILAGLGGAVVGYLGSAALAILVTIIIGAWGEADQRSKGSSISRMFLFILILTAAVLIFDAAFLSGNLVLRSFLE